MELAENLLDGIALDVHWLPFQLDGTLPKDGKPRADYLSEKFGGKERAQIAYSQIEETGHAMDIPFAFDLIEYSSNTLDAHRLIHWAGLEERQTPMVQALFDAYFTMGEDIGDRDTLVEIGVRAGLDRDMLTRLLDSDADAQSIRDRDAHARARGVNSVPTFVIANQSAVPGAQPPEFWAQVIEEITAQVKSANEAET